MDTLDSRIEEPVNVSIWSSALKWGAIGGVLTIVWSQLAQAIGITDALGQGGSAPMVANLFNYVIYAGAMVMAVKEVRTAMGGYISFGKAFGAAFVTALVMGIIGMIWFFIYTNFIYTDFATDMEALMMDQFEEQGLSGAEAEQAMEMAGMFTSTTGIAIMAVVGSAIIGAIIGLIVAAVMKKDRGFA